jgi:hypothetical protein
MGRFLLIAILSFLPRAALGMCLSVPVPDLVGEVDFPLGHSKEASFDVGVEFSEIENVWIEVEAQVFAREIDVCGTVFDPQPCVRVVQLLGFWATMDKEDSPNLGSVFSDGLSFSDDSQALEGFGVDIAVFNNRLVGWDFLLDGQGSLKLAWERVFLLPNLIIREVIDPAGEIFNARLIINGTPSNEWIRRVSKQSWRGRHGEILPGVRVHPCVPCGFTSEESRRPADPTIGNSVNSPRSVFGIDPRWGCSRSHPDTDRDAP